MTMESEGRMLTKCLLGDFDSPSHPCLTLGVQACPLRHGGCRGVQNVRGGTGINQ